MVDSLNISIRPTTMDIDALFVGALLIWGSTVCFHTHKEADRRFDIQCTKATQIEIRAHILNMPNPAGKPLIVPGRTSAFMLLPRSKRHASTENSLLKLVDGLQSPQTQASVPGGWKGLEGNPHEPIGHVSTLLFARSLW